VKDLHDEPVQRACNQAIGWAQHGGRISLCNHGDARRNPAEALNGEGLVWDKLLPGRVSCE